MQLRVATALPLITLACSSPAAPPGDVTLQVTNGTCRVASCDTLEVLAFPSTQPNTPGGLWSISLGLVGGPVACLSIPPSATFRIIGWHEDGTSDTTKIVWTRHLALSLGAQPPSWSRLQAAPSAGAFVPAEAPGWKITFPGGSEALPAAACRP